MLSPCCMVSLGSMFSIVLDPRQQLVDAGVGHEIVDVSPGGPQDG
jgi:hypothetical protein